MNASYSTTRPRKVVGYAVPAAEAGDFEQVPAELQVLPQWLCWKIETRNGDPVKVPKSARTGRNASTTKPAEWCDFATAVAAYQQGGVDGIGFVFTKESRIVGIDLDECIDADTGELAVWAQAVIADLDSYTEVSPSGRGLHAYVVGIIPQSRKKGSHTTSALEIYDNGRYFTVTGRRFTERFKVEERQEALTRVYTRAFGNGASSTPKPATSPPQSATSLPPHLALTDAELLDKARQAANGDRFTALFDRGDTSAYGGDDSAADMALCGLLAFWTQKEAGRMDRLFRQSGLMRPKWERADYRQRTLDKAIAECRETYSERKGGNGHDPAPLPDYSDYPEAIGARPGDGYGDHETHQDAPGSETSNRPELPQLELIRFTLQQVLTEPPAPQFIINGFMPVDVAAIVGTGGVGKSTLWLFQLVHIILSRPLWGMEITRPGPVVYVTAEDDRDRILWRLYWIMEQMELTEAERQYVVDNLHILDMVGNGRRLAQLDREGNIVITGLAMEIAELVAPIGPVITSVDPFVKFGPGERFVNDAEDAVVNALMRLRKAAKCAAFAIHHPSKAVAQSGAVSHHAGRGGAALGDGVRGAYQLLTITTDIATDQHPDLAKVYPEDIAKGRLLAYHITKLSDDEKPAKPLILRRHGWIFERLEAPALERVEAARKQARQEEAQRGLTKLITYLKEWGFRSYSRKDLEDLRDDIGLGRNAVRDAIARGLREGWLIEKALPETEQHGARKTGIYLAEGGRK